MMGPEPEKQERPREVVISTADLPRGDRPPIRWEPAPVNTRAKFRCESVTRFASGGSTVKLYPVTANCEENKVFWEATPSGQIELGITTDAASLFVPGLEYYVDFSLARGSDRAIAHLPPR